MPNAWAPMINRTPHVDGFIHTRMTGMVFTHMWDHDPERVRTFCEEFGTKPVKNYDDMKFIYVVADNATVDYWISIVNAQYDIPVGAGVTAVMAPKMYSFVEAKQMTGLLGGMKGTAEYEKLVGAPGTATRGMDAQSAAHLLIIFFVLIGNLGFFLKKGKPKRAE